MSRPAKSDVPVVILCGGKGTRLREETEYRPKPMVEIGPQPILWHIMKIYGAHGLDRFVLCLGYKGWEIKQYFLRYKEMHCDFTARDGRQPAARDPQPGRLREPGGSPAPRPAPRPPPAPGSGGCGSTSTTHRPSASPTATRWATWTSTRCSTSTGRRGGSPPSPASTPPRATARCGSTARKVLEFDEKPTLAEGVVSGGFFVFQREVFDYLDDDPQPLPGAAAAAAPGPRRPALGLPPRGVLAPDGHLPRLPPPERPLEARGDAVEDLVSRPRLVAAASAARRSPTSSWTSGPRRSPTPTWSRRTSRSAERVLPAPRLRLRRVLPGAAPRGGAAGGDLLRLRLLLLLLRELAAPRRGLRRGDDRALRPRRRRTRWSRSPATTATCCSTSRSGASRCSASSRPRNVAAAAEAAGIPTLVEVLRRGDRPRAGGRGRAGRPRWSATTCSPTCRT